MIHPHGSFRTACSGIWQLDDANDYAQRLTHAERAHAQTGAETALEILWHNYCKKRDTTTSIIVHLQKALSENAWNACQDDPIDGPNPCYSAFERIVKGDPFPTTRNTENLQSDRLYDERLHLNIDRTLIDEYGGGIQSVECDWRDSTRIIDTFPCYLYDISNAEGYLWLSDELTGSDTVGRSPLALPFFSFKYAYDDGDTETDLQAKYIVFKRENTGYDVDLIAAVPTNRDVLSYPKIYRATGWWHSENVNGWILEER